MIVKSVVSNPKGLPLDKENPIKSTTYGEAVYYAGAHIKEPNYNGDIRVECAEGLHFFMTKKEAKEWV